MHPRHPPVRRATHTEGLVVSADHPAGAAKAHHWLLGLFIVALVTTSSTKRHGIFFLPIVMQLVHHVTIEG